MTRAMAFPRTLPALLAALLALALSACGPASTTDAAAAASADDAAATAQPPGPPPSDDPFVLVFLGDSLTAGFRLPPEDALPEQVEARLLARGFRVDVRNAGVSGDTIAQGLARFDWSVPTETDAIVVALGANDMLQGRAAADARADFNALMARVAERELWTAIVGLRAPRNLPPTDQTGYSRMYLRAAAGANAPLFPDYFAPILEATTEGGVPAQTLIMDDGLHPTAEGIGVTADAIATWLAAELPAEAQPAATQ